jgi:hypothetical protein
VNPMGGDGRHADGGGGPADCLRRRGAAVEVFGIRATPLGAVWREIKGASYDKE